MNNEASTDQIKELTERITRLEELVKRQGEEIDSLKKNAPPRGGRRSFPMSV